jgi:hypothetical protein
MQGLVFRKIARKLEILRRPKRAAPISIAQELSREDAIKEAGRLGTESEQIRAEAYKQIEAGADRRLLLEAERAAAERFRKAIELWRSTGDDQRQERQLPAEHFICDMFERFPEVREQYLAGDKEDLIKGLEYMFDNM